MISKLTKHEYASCSMSRGTAQDLGSLKIRMFEESLWNTWNWWESTQPDTQKANFDSCATEVRNDELISDYPLLTH